MTANWQTWAALAIVAATAAIMIYRLVRKKRGCASGCGCGDLKKNVPASWNRKDAIK